MVTQDGDADVGNMQGEKRTWGGVLAHLDSYTVEQNQWIETQ